MHTAVETGACPSQALAGACHARTSPVTMQGYPQHHARISSTPCEDILNTMRGYPQHLARISSTPREDILIFFQTPN